MASLRDRRTSSSSARAATVAAGALALSLLLAMPASAAPAGEITVERFEHIPGEGKAWSFRVEGKSSLPDAAVLTLTVEFEGEQAHVVLCPVESGAFGLDIGPSEKKLLPGRYLAKVTFNRRDQLPDVLDQIPPTTKPAAGELPMIIGTPEDAAAEREKVRKKYVTVVDNVRQVHGQLGQWGGFTMEAAKWHKVEAMVKRKDLDGGAVDGVLEEWERFTDEVWERFYHTVRHDHVAFRDYVFSSYFAAVDRELESLYNVLERWYKAYGREIYRTVDRPIPKKYDYDDPFPFDKLYADSLAISKRIYHHLGEKPVDWRLLDLHEPETSKDEKGDLFRSSVAKFEVSKPGPDWVFSYERTTPGMRLRIRPKVPDKDVANAVIIAVEIHDFPIAESFRDLARIKEIASMGRWEGYKEVEKTNIKADDPTMPDGKRPGLDMTLLSSFETRVFQVRDYALFCRWHKRTYDVICIASKENFSKYEEVFEQIAASFKVLDAPEAEKKPDETPGAGDGDGDDGGG